jgi:hypothetical protein
MWQPMAGLVLRQQKLEEGKSVDFTGEQPSGE